MLRVRVAALLLIGALSGCTCGNPPASDPGVATSQITSPGEGAIVRGNPLTVTGTAASSVASVAKVEVSTNGGATWAPATGTDSWSYAFTAPDGTYTLMSRASNEGGASEASPPAVHFTLDNTAPEVSLTSAAAGAILVGTHHALLGHASDAVGVALVELSFDGGATWVKAAGTGDWAYTWDSPEVDGSYEIRVRATDKAGNVSAPVSMPVVVDRELPTSSITYPAAGAFLRGPVETLTGMAASRFSTVASVEVSTDGTVWVAASGTTAFTSAWTLPEDGRYRIYSRAKDVLGGVEGSPIPVNVVVDKTVPASALTTPAAPTAVRGSRLLLAGSALDVSAADGSSSGVAQVEVSTDDGATWTAASGTAAWTFDWTLPADGTYVVRTRATDRAGNMEMPPSGTAVIVDNTLPASAVVSPAAGATVNGGVVTVTGTASDALSGVTLVEVSTNGGLTWMAATGTTSWSYAFTPSDGAHDVRARATDAAGNVQAIAAPHIFTVDNTAPACAISDPADGQFISGTAFTATGTASDATSGVLHVEFSVDDGATWGLAAGTTSWSYTFTPPGNGTYRLRCRAADRAGNVSGPSTAHSVTVDQSLPSSRITAPANGDAFQSTSFTVRGTASVSGATITKVEVSTDNGVTWALATGTTAWTYSWSGIAEGTFTLRSRATNSNNTVETSSPPVTVKVDRTPPTSNITSPPAFARGSTVTLSGVASDSSSGVARVEISFDDGATYTPVTSGTALWSHTWTLPADGTYSLRTRAVDQAGNVEVPAANVIVKVDNTEPTSAIGAPAAGSNLAGTTATLTGTASDATAGIARVEISTDDGSTWTPASGGTVWSYTWTLPADGTYVVRTRAVDQAGNVESAGPSVSVRVDNTLPISAISDPVASQDIRATTYTVRGTASDGTGSGLLRVEVSTNGGASWTPATGTGTWTYSWTTPADGSVTLQARARDQAGNVEVAGPSVTVRIDKTAPATTIVSPAGGINLTGTGTTITGLVAEGGSGVTSVEVSTNGGTSWSAATVSGTTWSYTWTLPADGTYVLRSRGTDRAGNVETPQAGNTVKVDNTRPSSAITAPANGARLNQTTYTVTGTYSDGSGSGVTQVEVSTNGGTSWVAATLGAPGTWSYSWTTPADGSYTIRSRATDAVGLVETPLAGNAIGVDKTLPSSAIGSPADGTSISTLTQVISGTAGDGMGTGVSTVEVSTDDGATWSPATGTGAWTYTWTLPGTPGSSRVKSRATDAAGNVEVPGAARTYQALPNISMIVPGSAAAGTAVTLAGFRFGATQGTSTVTFNGVAAPPALSWSSGSIRLAVPATATTGNTVVTANALASAGATFTVLAQPAAGGSTVLAGGDWAAMKLGPDGLPRVAHVNGTGQLVFSAYAGSAWTSTVIDTGGPYRYVSMAVDSNGVNSISYNLNSGAASALRYATCSASCDQAASWTKLSVVTGNLTGQFTAIALDSARKPRIAYYDAGATGACSPAVNLCAKYVACTGTCTTAAGWSAPETIDTVTSNNVGQNMSMAIDSMDRPHVAYYDTRNRNLLYAVKTAGLWGITPPTGTQTGTIGRLTSIALKADLPRISYLDATNNLLFVSTFTGAGWVKSAALDTGTGYVANGGTVMLVGNDGNDRVVYYHSGTTQLRMVTFNGTAWGAPQTLATGGSYPAAALDGLNRVRAVHQSGTNLMYYSAP